MLKIRGQTPDKRPMLVLGLTRLNLDLLGGDEDRPIGIELSELGFGNGVIIIVGGETQVAIAEKLHEAGILPADAVQEIRLNQVPED